MQNIPLTDTPRQAITTLLGGQRVTLSVWWQPLSEAWYVTLDFGDDRVATARQVIPWERIIGPVANFSLATCSCWLDARLPTLRWAARHGPRRTRSGT